MLTAFHVNHHLIIMSLYILFHMQGLGVPFNIASYSLLTYMIAHICGLKVPLCSVLYMYSIRGCTCIRGYAVQYTNCNDEGRPSPLDVECSFNGMFQTGQLQIKTNCLIVALATSSSMHGIMNMGMCSVAASFIHPRSIIPLYL